MTGLPQKLAANLSAIVLLIVGAAFAGDGPTVHEPPEWAYPLNRSGPPKPLPDDGLLHVPGSSVGRIIFFGPSVQAMDQGGRGRHGAAY